MQSGRWQANGRFTAFASPATDLVVNDNNGEPDLFLHDVVTDTVARVSVASDGTDGRGDSADDNCPMVADPLRTDNDGDGIGDLCDTCPRFANPNQADTDRDGLGDDCDNCPRLANADQADTLGDGVGDVCRFCQQCMTGRGGWRSVIGR